MKREAQISTIMHNTSIIITFPSLPFPLRSYVGGADVATRGPCSSKTAPVKQIVSTSTLHVHPHAHLFGNPSWDIAP